MKRKTTKEILAESFRELSKKKSVEKITIQEIVDNCDFSPATFYRHFRDKYDLMAWDYTHDTSAIMKQIDDKEYFWEQTLTDAAEYYDTHREYLKNLLTNTSGYNAFVRNMAEINVELLKNEVARKTENTNLPKDVILLIKLYCYGMVELSCEWIVGEISTTPEEMEEAYKKAMPEVLRAYLQE